jgi:hypothetical protein
LRAPGLPRHGGWRRSSAAPQRVAPQQCHTTVGGAAGVLHRALLPRLPRHSLWRRTTTAPLPVAPQAWSSKTCSKSCSSSKSQIYRQTCSKSSEIQTQGQNQAQNHKHKVIYHKHTLISCINLKILHSQTSSPYWQT